MSRYSGGNAADSLAIVREFPLKVVLANQKNELMANVEVCLSGRRERMHDDQCRALAVRRCIRGP